MAGEKGSKKPPENHAEDENKLKHEVKAFAAQLGLGSGVGGGSWDGAFDDFAPTKAKQKIGDAHGKNKNFSRKSSGSKPQQQPERHRGVGKPGHSANRSSSVKDEGKTSRKISQDNGARTNQKEGLAEDVDEMNGGRGIQKGTHVHRQQQQARGWAEDDIQAPKGRVKSILPRDEPAVWFEAAASLPNLPSPSQEAEPAVVQSKRAAAEKLLQNEEQAFETDMGRRGGQDLRWLQQARKSGTTQDKVAAMSVLIQESAVANLKSLDGLIAQCSKTKGGRGVVGTTMDALRELFTTVLLPDRKLRYFEQQPLGGMSGGKDADRQLLYWFLEDGVKKRYGQFVDLLDACSRDNLEFVKDKAVKTMYDLLSKKPEAEQQLLSSLVNKLGDPDRKLASKVGHLLTRLLSEHPMMKGVVVREVERFVFRPGLSDRGRYYCVIFLNQLVLSHRESQGGSALSRKLIDLYFTLFKMIMDGKIGTAAAVLKQQQEKREAGSKKGGGRGPGGKGGMKGGARGGVSGGKVKGKGKGGKGGGKVQAPAAKHLPSQSDISGELDARILSALIAGIRRAFPYVSPEDVEPLIEAHADSLFRLIHTRSFGVATQALLLLFQLMHARSSVSDRFYRALYSVLQSPELTRSTKATMFLSLLYKAMCADVSQKRVAAFAKRILQVSQEAPPNFACGCLMMLSEVMKACPALWSAVLQPEDNEKGEEHFVDADVADAPAGKAGMEGAELAAAAAGTTVAGRAGREVVARIDLGSESESEASDAAEDIQESDSDDMGPEQGPQAEAKVFPVAHPVQAQHAKRQQQGGPPPWPSQEGYDMKKREPQFSHAERSCLWELSTLASHVHPSVAAMARTLLAGMNVSFNGDPLRHLTLGAFLDKFVQKKAKAGDRGGSLMQPLLPGGVQGMAADVASAPSAAFAALSERDVAPDALFFHKYYSLAGVQSKVAGKKRKKGDDVEELLSDESEEEDAIEDFLAGEEEGGEEGIGADPDRANDYDYADLAAAMDDEEASDADSDGDGGPAGESDSEAGSLEGAEFSDLSGDDADDSPGTSDADSERGDGGGGEDEDRMGIGSSGDEDDHEEDDSSGDPEVEDAEVEALLQQHGLLGKAGEESLSDSLDSQLNPFHLAEAGSSGDEEESVPKGGAGERGRLAGRQARQKAGKRGGGVESAGKKRRGSEGEQGVALGSTRRKKGRGRGGEREDVFGSASAFASADDYVALIDKAEAEEMGVAEGDDGRRRRKEKKKVGRSK